MLGPSTLIVGLGNPILGDDGVGWRIVDALAARLPNDDVVGAAAGEVELDRVAVGGLSLMERMVGYDHVVLVDAVLSGGPPGAVSAGSLAATHCRSASHLDSAHDAPLTEALSAGRALGASLPADISVVGVAIDRVDTFSDRLTPPVAAAIEPAVEAILAILRRSAAAV